MYASISNNASSGSNRFQNHYRCIASYLEQLEATPADFETQADVDAALWVSVASGVKILSSKQQNQN